MNLNSIPKEIEAEIIKFFLDTSFPRIIKDQEDK